MEAAFENVARSYDSTFTNTLTGRYQRKAVWDYLNTRLPNSKSLDILELNCGTGEDAIHLANQGHKVLATDVSDEMIKVANSKKTNDSNANLNFQVMDIRAIDSMKGKTFDLIFSNFGGLNCLSPQEFSHFTTSLNKFLKPKGHFVGVIMPRFCLMESIYFLLKFDTKKAFRRSSKQVNEVHLSGTNLNVWYYSPGQVRTFFKNVIVSAKQEGIGIFIPPSYLDSKFSKYKYLMKVLSKTDRMLSSIPFLASISDHYLIDIEVRQ